MSLLVQQFAALTGEYRPPSPPQGAGRVHVIADDPDEDPVEVLIASRCNSNAQLQRGAAAAKSIGERTRGQILAVIVGRPPMLSGEVAAAAELPLKLCCKHLLAMVSEGALVRTGAHRSYRYAVPK